MALEKEPSSSFQNSPERRSLLYILFSAFGVLWLLSKLRTPNENASESVHPQDTPEHETPSGQTASGSVLMVQPPSNPGNPKDRRRRHTPWWEKAAVFIALGLLIANWYQGCQTKKAADAAKQAADTASKTLLISEQAHVTIGRSDGTVAEIIMTNDSKDKAGIIVYFQNSGHIPAKFNWGSDSPVIAILPADPNAVKESQYTSQWLPFKTDHEFRPMWRAKNRKQVGSFSGSGSITIAGNSAYQGIFWELPKDRMLQLMNWDRPFVTHGKFDYCDGFGHHICRRFSVQYVRSPYNRFILVGGDECANWEYQILNPNPDWDYLSPCESAEQREELKAALKNSPKP